MLNCPYPRPNLQFLGPGPGMVKAAPARLPPALPAAPMACVHQRQFFSERAARSLPQNLLDEKDLTHFLGKYSIKDTVVCVT